MFLILCSYVYLTCLPGFPTRFTGSRIVVQIPWGSSTSTAPRPWDSPSTPTISSPTARNRFVSILRTLTYTWLWWHVVGPKAAVVFLSSRKHVVYLYLSLKNHVVYTIVYILFFGPHLPIPFTSIQTEAEPSRGDWDEVSLARWLRHGDGQGGERLLGRCETGGDLGPRRLVFSYGDPYGAYGEVLGTWRMLPWFFTCWKMKSAAFTQIFWVFYVVLRWVNIL